MKNIFSLIFISLQLLASDCLAPRTGDIKQLNSPGKKELLFFLYSFIDLVKERKSFEEISVPIESNGIFRSMILANGKKFAAESDEIVGNWGFFDCACLIIRTAEHVHTYNRLIHDLNEEDSRGNFSVLGNTMRIRDYLREQEYSSGLVVIAYDKRYSYNKVAEGLMAQCPGLKILLIPVEPDQTGYEKVKVAVTSREGIAIQYGVGRAGTGKIETYLPEPASAREVIMSWDEIYALFRSDGIFTLYEHPESLEEVSESV